MLVKVAARLAAAQVLKDYWDGTFPVNPVEIAESKNIDVEFESLRPGVSGAIVATPFATTILIDRDENYGRQMFTCAHELGHYEERMANDDEEFSFVEQRSKKYDLHEFYADEFAGNLLMPEADFRKQVSEGCSEYMMAARYGVTPAAISKRKERLGL